MVAVPFKITVNAGTTVSDGTGGTSVFTEQLTFEGNTLSKTNLDIPADSTVPIRIYFPTAGTLDDDSELVKVITLGCTGANLTIVTSDDDDGLVDRDTIALLKSRPLIYYPGGPTDNPFEHAVRHIKVTNADLLKPAVFHLRALYNAIDPAVE